MATHDKTMIEAVPCSTMGEVGNLLDNYDIIGVDEGQFFSDIVEESERLAMAGKTVIIAALDGTFQRKAFGRCLELVPLAEKVTKLVSVCHVCKGDAHFTRRITESTEIELIGGTDLYQAVCRKCFDVQEEEERRLTA